VGRIEAAKVRQGERERKVRAWGHIRFVILVRQNEIPIAGLLERCEVAGKGTAHIRRKDGRACAVITEIAACDVGRNEVEEVSLDKGETGRLEPDEVAAGDLCSLTAPLETVEDLDERPLAQVVANHGQSLVDKVVDIHALATKGHEHTLEVETAAMGRLCDESLQKNVG